MDFTLFQSPEFQELFWKILITSSLAAVGCAYIGIFLILRKMIFFGIGLTQVSTLGLAIASILGVSSFFVESSSILLTIFLFSFFASRGHHSRESLIAIVYCAATGIAILLVANSPQGDTHILYSIKGNILGVSSTQIYWLIGLLSVIGTVHFFFYKQFLITTFDPIYSKTLHLKVKFWDILLYSTIGILIAFVTKLVGSLMVFSLLIFPGILAIKLFRKLSHAFIFAIIFSFFSCFLGVGLSIMLDYPTGPSIVSMAFVFMIVISLIFAFVKLIVRKA